MYQLPTRRVLVHKAIEPRKLSVKTQALAARRLGDLWEVKYDGVHCIIIYKDGRAYAFSRQGEPVNGSMDHVLRILEKHLPKDAAYAFFGEAWRPDVSHQEINGEFRRGNAGSDPHNLEMVFFDYVPLADFEAGVCPVRFQTRRYALTHMIYDIMRTYAVRKRAPVRVSYLSTCKEHCEQLVEAERGFGNVFAIDGYMRKDPEGIWKAGAGSCGSILKDKDNIQVDLKVDSIFEGKGKFAGMLGGFNCTYKGKKQKVGGGTLTDKERKFYWDFPNRIVGSIIEVHGLSESEGRLLREPRFHRLREDKSEGE